MFFHPSWALGADKCSLAFYSKETWHQMCCYHCLGQNGSPSLSFPCFGSRSSADPVHPQTFLLGRNPWVQINVITAVPPVWTFSRVAYETEEREDKERISWLCSLRKSANSSNKPLLIKAVPGQELQGEWRATARHNQWGSLQLQQLCFPARYQDDGFKHFSGETTCPVLPSGTEFLHEKGSPGLL